MSDDQPRGLGQKNRFPFPLRLLVCVALAGVFTTVQILWSMRHGRLSTLPQYDDVVYFLDGLTRVRFLKEHGLFAFITDLVVYHPLWAPWGALNACVGFRIFGEHVWAPYIMNSVLVLALLMIADRLTRGARPLVKLCSWTLVLTMPLAAHAVVDFRPDFAAGFSTAVAILFALRITSTRQGRKAALLTGVFAGLALFAKPTIFAATVVYVGGAGLIMCARELLTMRKRPDAKLGTLVVNILISMGATILIAGPHYARQFRAYIYYFKINTLGFRADLWDKGLNGFENVTYFLTGDAGKVMFGNVLIPVLLLAVGGVVAAVVLRRRDRLLELAQIWAAALICLLVPTINTTKNPYFGMVFTTLVMSLAVLAIRNMLTPPDPAQKPSRVVVVGTVLVVLVSVGMARFPMWSPGSVFNTMLVPDIDTTRSTEMVLATTDAIEEAMERAQSAREAGGDTPVTLYYTGSGYLNRHTVAYLLMQRGHDRPKASHGYDSTLLVFHARSIRLADVVIAFEPGIADEQGNALLHERFPGNHILGTTLAIAQSDTGLNEFARIPSPAGPEIVVFLRTGESSIRPRDYKDVEAVIDPINGSPNELRRQGP